MSFVRYKTLKGKKYAYEVTTYWDAQVKQARQNTRYLGVVTDDGKITKPNTKNHEKLILDFGDGYLLHEAMKSSPCYEILKQYFPVYFEELLVLIFYRITMQSAMYNCQIWFEGNILSLLYPHANLTSQNTSKILSALGEETVQRNFFLDYIKKIEGVKRSVIIDATSLPNQIHSIFNSWGHSDNSIEKQFKLLCVLDQDSKAPLFYRYLPGNLPDVATLKTTLLELSKMGVQSVFVLIDAGYFSEGNVKELYAANIHFMARLPASRSLYKELVSKESGAMEKIENATIVNTRGIFVKEEKINLYGHTAYAYLVLDPERKGKEMNQLLVEHFCAKVPVQINEVEFNQCGMMILISSEQKPKDTIVECYYMRQSVEQVFGYYKDDLGLLPIRRHNEDTIRGYLFLQFLSLVFFIQLRQVLHEHFTVEQALLHLRTLKCKLFDKEVIVSEPTRKHKDIFERFQILVPNFLGI
jgi:transposase